MGWIPSKSKTILDTQHPYWYVQKQATLEQRNKPRLKVLVACEFSGTIRDAFLARGHDAWSCDLLPTEKLGPHIKDDVLKHLDEGWDLMIAHPPCTYLANSGVWVLHRDPGRWTKMEEGAHFFKKFLDADIPSIAVENPIMHKYAVAIIGRRQDQIIQPYEFGHSESKATGLWLKDLPPLIPTKILPLPAKGHWDNQTPSGRNKIGPSPDRGKIRSLTYQGIADAMATQWG